MTVRVGVFGAGFARTATLPALRTIPNVEVVGVASARLSSAQRAANEFAVTAAYDDWQKLLIEQRPDLVCVVTPTYLHSDMVLASLESGAHVLCEKPMAMNRVEAAEMLATAQRAGKLHMIDHELRFNPNRKKIKRLLDANAVGEIRHVEILNITSYLGDPASRRVGDWLSHAKTGGGIVGSNGSHQVDLLRWWFGEVDAVGSHVQTLVKNRLDADTGTPWQATADDFFSATLEMRSGVIATLTVSMAARHHFGASIRIHGSEGTIVLADKDERLLFAEANQEFEEITEEDANALRPGIAQRVWNISVVALLEELVSAIRESRPLSAGATFEDGLRCQEVLDAMRLSSDQRRWVSVEEAAV